MVLEPPEHGGDARIVAVLPRQSRFSRRAAGDPTEEQVVAANIDTVFLVAGLDGDFNPRRIERYLLVATESGATPVIVLNKADVVDERRARWPTPCVRWRERRRFTRSRAACPAAVDVLRQYLGPGRTGRLLGSSGVGKSTIVNRLIGHDLLRTQDVRESDSRGRHTSTARQLVLLPESGVLIDTPGMRELQLWDSGETIGGAFADIEALAATVPLSRLPPPAGARMRGARGGRRRRAAGRPPRELSQAAGRAGAPGAAAGPARPARGEAPVEDPRPRRCRSGSKERRTASPSVRQPAVRR